jgi:hypothetical protein
MSRYARRVDGPHRAIRQALEAAGCLVLDVSAAAGLGCDLVVIRGDRCRVVEVKDGHKAPSKRQLTDSEAALLLRAPQVYRIIGSVDEALRVAGELVR